MNWGGGGVLQQATGEYLMPGNLESET